MNPYDERRLRDEVIYLHSLWRQGPPPPPPPPSPPPPNPIHLPIQTPNYTIPYSYSQSYIPQPLGAHFHAYNYPQHLRHQQPTTNPFAPAHTRPLPPTNTSTTFKKRKNHNNNNTNNQNQKKTEKKKKNQQKRITREPTNNSVTQADPEPPWNLGPEWPCPVLPDPPEKCWPKPRSDPPPKVVSPQEKERLVALQAQRKARHAFREFLNGSDDDDDDDDDASDDDEDDGLEGFEEFFLGIFMEDHEMRSYYQRCYESGEFCCFVCGAIGKKKSGKKFKDCIGLVQHSMAISRTVKKRAHRAFGHTVCKVLGWDIDRLPTIVMKGEPLRCPVQMKPDEEEVM